MRSKSSGVESPANGVLRVPQAMHDINQEEEVNLHAPIKSLKVKVQPNNEEVEGLVVSDIEKSTEDSSGTSDQRLGIINFTKEDLLRLLGVMECEVQVSLTHVDKLPYAHIVHRFIANCGLDHKSCQLGCCLLVLSTRWNVLP